MAKQGLFEESYYLYKFKKYNALKTLGYQEIFQSVEKKYKKSKIKKKIKINSKKYIKRQITWFKKNKNIKWFNISSIKKIYNYIKTKLI